MNADERGWEKRLNHRDTEDTEKNSSSQQQSVISYELLPEMLWILFANQEQRIAHI